MSPLNSTTMSEQTTDTTPATNVSASGVERSPEEPRLPSGPLPTFDHDLPSLEVPGVIPSWKAIMRVLRRLRPHPQS